MYRQRERFPEGGLVVMIDEKAPNFDHDGGGGRWQTKVSSIIFICPLCIQMT